MIQQTDNLPNTYQLFPDTSVTHIQGITAKMLLIITSNTTHYVTDTYAELLYLTTKHQNSTPKLLLITPDKNIHIKPLTEHPTHIPTEQPLSKLPDKGIHHTWSRKQLIHILYAYEKTKNQLANLIAAMVNITATKPYIWPKTLEPYTENTIGFSYTNPIAHVIHSASFGEQYLYTAQDDNIENINLYNKQLKQCVLCIPSEKKQHMLLIPNGKIWTQITNDNQIHDIDDFDLTTILDKQQTSPYRLMAMPYQSDKAAKL